MATALIKYDLNDIDDKMEFKRANQSLDMALAIWDIVYNHKKQAFRKLENDPNSTDREYDLVESIFNSINETIDEHDIKIDSIIE